MRTRHFTDRHDWVLLLVGVACPLLAWLFASFGADVLDGEMRAADAAVRDWIFGHRKPWMVATADVISTLGATEILLWIGVATGLSLLWRRHGYAWIVLLIACAIFSSEFVGLLKATYAVGRPPTGVLERESLSFPSGHSSGSAAISVFLCYVLVRTRRVSVLVGITAGVAVMLLVGISRMYLDFHWLSDVIGGFIIGATIGAGCCAIWEFIQHHQRTRAATPTGLAASHQGDSTRRS